MTTREDVRDFLNKIDTGKIKDETIELMISMAKIIVEKEKSSSSDNDTVDAAILMQSTWMSYLAYAGEFERSVGRIPPPMLLHLDRLEKLAIQYLNYVRRGSTAKLQPQAAFTNSIESVTSF